MMTQSDFLKKMALKYIWWKSPEQSLQNEQKIIAKIMDIGDYEDVQILIHLFGEQRLQDALKNAEPGMFNERSWAYWHYRLGLSHSEQIPPLPKRAFPA